MEELVVGVRLKKTGKLCYFYPQKYTFNIGDNIVAKTDRGKEIGRVVCDNHRSLYVEFLAITNCNKEAICLQEGETINFAWINEEKINSFDERLVTKRILQFL